MLLSSFATILSVCAVLFLSTFIRSTFGFGDALIAMPLLALVVGIKIATPLVAFAATTIAATILLNSWRDADMRAAWRLIVSSIAGIPFGLWVLNVAPEGVVKAILGVILILFGLYNLIQPRMTALESNKWAFALGFAGGVLGGAYNTNGPPVVLYGTLRRWPPARFRATLQGYFLPTGFFILLGHGLGGLWTTQVLQLFAIALIPILLAIFAGKKINEHINPSRFERLIYAVLIIFGVLLIV